MPAFIDLVGHRFGRLVIVSRALNRGRRTCWLCQCDCGKQKVIGGENLHAGTTRSCGCLHTLELLRRNTTHQMYGTLAYVSWNEMKERCRNPHNKKFPRYGGRGIKVCDRWSSFEAFYADMGPRPSPAYTIDRKDNDGPYSPENCRWATKIEQARNTSRVHLLTFDGKTQTLAGWAEELGMSYTMLRARIRRGWPIDEALTRPTMTCTERRAT